MYSCHRSPSHARAWSCVMRSSSGAGVAVRSARCPTIFRCFAVTAAGPRQASCGSSSPLQCCASPPSSDALPPPAPSSLRLSTAAAAPVAFDALVPSSVNAADIFFFHGPQRPSLGSGACPHSRLRLVSEAQRPRMPVGSCNSRPGSAEAFRLGPPAGRPARAPRTTPPTGPQRTSAEANFQRQCL